MRTVKCTDARGQRQCTHRCCRVCQDFGFSFLAVVSPCVSTVWKTLSLSAALLFCVHRALGENKIQTSVGEKIPRRKCEKKKNSPERIVIMKVWQRKTNITKFFCCCCWCCCLSGVINKHLHSLQIFFFFWNVQHVRGEKKVARVLPQCSWRTGWQQRNPKMLEDQKGRD